MAGIFLKKKQTSLWRLKNSGHDLHEDQTNALDKRTQNTIFHLHTGQCLLRIHPKRLGLSDSAHCKYSSEEQLLSTHYKPAPTQRPYTNSFGQKTPNWTSNSRGNPRTTEDSRLPRSHRSEDIARSSHWTQQMKAKENHWHDLTRDSGEQLSELLQLRQRPLHQAIGAGTCHCAPVPLCSRPIVPLNC